MADDVATLLARTRARLDADAEIAERATPGPWHIAALGRPYPQRITSGQALIIADTFTAPEHVPVDALHITRHHPARVLATVAALREVLDIIERDDSDLANSRVGHAMLSALDRIGGDHG